MTLKAHNSTPSCWQMFANGTIDGAEDCLSVDIYTPYVRYDSPLPVSIYIFLNYSLANLHIEEMIY